MTDGTREFRDPIHGFIKVDPLERAIIDTFPFQRLRRISQLALTSYVYHGAEHSRFGHSLGVMHLAGRATSVLLDKNQGLLRDLTGWSGAEFDDRRSAIVKMARLAGLLHDVGHSPFSHAGEESLFPEKLRHEDYSTAIAESDVMSGAIDAALNGTPYSRDDLLRVLRGEPLPPELGFLVSVVSSAYDVDKMDYLLRDSHYCGVEYGRFDLRRLISSLTLYEERGGELTLAVEEGGYHALEALVLARYFMFTQVYFHKVCRAYDLILTEFIKELLTEQYGQATYPEPGSLSEYLAWDDASILAKLIGHANEDPANAAWMLLNRRHPKVAYETLPHPDPMEARHAFRKLLPEVREKFPEIRFWSDTANDHPEKYKQEDIPLRRSVPDGWRSFASVSEVLKGLQPIGQYRLYAYVGDQRELLDEITDFCRKAVA